MLYTTNFVPIGSESDREAAARQAMAALSEKNSMMGRAPMNYGIGVHVGDVMYGNIGSRTRIDFTVIGPAVNMASRLEALTKQLGKKVLLSRAFAGHFPRQPIPRCAISSLWPHTCATCACRASCRAVAMPGLLALGRSQCGCAGALRSSPFPPSPPFLGTVTIPLSFMGAVRLIGGLPGFRCLRTARIAWRGRVRLSPLTGPRPPLGAPSDVIRTAVHVQ